MKKLILVSSFVLAFTLSAVPQANLGTSGQTPEKSQPAPNPSSSVAGKWKFVFDTEGGDRTYLADFQQDGENVSGKWANKDTVKGTFSKGKLALEFPADSDEVGPGTLKITGDLTDILKGSWSFQSYSGTFTATRDKS